jgi:hypothetical protein
MTWPETIVVKSCHSVSKNRIDQTNPRTDVSPASLAAIDYAVDLGMPDKATILIVFLIDSIQYSIPALLILTRFFLSDYPDWGRTVTRRRVEEYVREHFTDSRGYHLSCDQDVLLLRRRD